MSQTIAVTFDACQTVRENMIERLYVTTKFPGQMTLKDSFMTSELPILPLFGGVVKRTWIQND